MLSHLNRRLGKKRKLATNLKDVLGHARKAIVSYARAT